VGYSPKMRVHPYRPSPLYLWIPSPPLPPPKHLGALTYPKCKHSPNSFRFGWSASIPIPQYFDHLCYLCMFNNISMFGWLAILLDKPIQLSQIFEINVNGGCWMILELGEHITCNRLAKSIINVACKMLGSDDHGI
jgi:hypothetical protein